MRLLVHLRVACGKLPFKEQRAESNVQEDSEDGFKETEDGPVEE